MMSRKRVAATYIFATLVVFGATATGQSPDKPMPPAAVGVLTQMEKDIAATKMKAVVTLDKVLKETTKRGDLAGAVAIKEAIDQLKAEAQGSLRTGAGTSGGNAAVGQWAAGSTTLNILADGRASFDYDDSSKWEGKWRMEASGLRIDWANGYTHRLTITPVGLTGVRVHPSGSEKPQQFTRKP